jgi:putative Mg2+ transporter-C (MgtC) family protein
MISSSTVLLRLFMALLLGLLIGLEREYRHRMAGLRTNAPVAVGTALFTIISAYGFDEFLSEKHILLDCVRIASCLKPTGYHRQLRSGMIQCEQKL